MMPCPYAVLGVARGASDDEIKRAYRKLAVRWHPDKNPTAKAESEARFKEIGQAYASVKDAQSRREYHAELDAATQHSAAYEAAPHARAQPPAAGRPASSTSAFSGAQRGGASAFSFLDAESLFRQFFGGDPFAGFFDVDPDPRASRPAAAAAADPSARRGEPAGSDGARVRSSGFRGGESGLGVLHGLDDYPPGARVTITRTSDGVTHTSSFIAGERTGVRGRGSSSRAQREEAAEAVALEVALEASRAEAARAHAATYAYDFELDELAAALEASRLPEPRAPASRSRRSYDEAAALQHALAASRHEEALRRARLEEERQVRLALDLSRAESLHTL
jgi:curved DNA-binding protein CbpA